uniref:CSON001247 protein n=1 Tax=Culicoides sonorensis TaxID=179676 RepID=A0A336LQQ5_CULSO
MYRIIVLSLCLNLIPKIAGSIQCYECEEIRDNKGMLITGNCSMNGGARIMTHCFGRCGQYIWYNHDTENNKMVLECATEENYCMKLEKFKPVGYNFACTTCDKNLCNSGSKVHGKGIQWLLIMTVLVISVNDYLK